MINKIYDPDLKKRKMNIVVFGSGECSTIEAFIKYKNLQKDCKFNIAALFTDNINSMIHKIAPRENIPLIYNDLSKFMEEKGLNFYNKKEKNNEEMRSEFDEKTKEKLIKCANENNFEIDLICLAGYMLKLHSPIINTFDGKIINSHPSNLSIVNKNGKRKYTGDHAVLDAINNMEQNTYTSIHIVREKVDYGEILVISKPLQVDLNFIQSFKKFTSSSNPYYISYNKRLKKINDFSKPEFSIKFLKIVAELHQRVQKYVCDYPAYLFALNEISSGNFSLENSNIIYKNEIMPNGVLL